MVLLINNFQFLGEKKVVKYDEGTFAQVHCYLTLGRRQSMIHYFIKTPTSVALILSLVMMTYPPNSVKRYKLSAVSITILFFVLLFIVNKIGFVGNKGIPIVVFNSGTSIVFITVLALLFGSSQ